jgi:hypothetical protein
MDAIVIIAEVRASALFVCLGGRVDDAHSCEIVRCLAMRQYVKQTEMMMMPFFCSYRNKK